jgi:hypothetical protein
MPFAMPQAAFFVAKMCEWHRIKTANVVLAIKVTKQRT